MFASPRVIALLAFCAIAATRALPAQAPPFPPATPEEVGLASAKLDALVDRLQRWVDDGEVVGAELLLVKDRRTVLHEVVGWRDREREIPMARGTIFRIRSMTKPFIGTAVLMLAEAGALALDDRIAQYLPSFANARSKDITVEHLLRHRGGFEQPGYPAPLDSYASLRAAVDAVGTAGPVTTPGADFVYSDAGSATLGALVAAVSGVPVEQFVTERILQPLALDSTFCNLVADDPRRPRVSSTYARRDDGSFEKYWDAREPQAMPFFRASGGIYSTPVDYARFLATWLDLGRIADGTRLLTESSVRAALTLDESGPADYARHWEIFGERRAELPPFGHGGSDGTLAMALPEADLIVCYFTQSRRSPTIREFRHAVQEAVDPGYRSLSGAPLFPTALAAAVRTRREAQLEAARAAHQQTPEDLDALVWLGRRTAYLGRYHEAIEIFSRGLEEHPDEPRLLRHRGHRHLTVRALDAAVADLQHAAALIAGTPDEVEADGLPNARNVPTSTLHANIWYHLGLAHYLRGEFEAAALAYAECLAVSLNPDMLCATTHWYYMTLRRLGRDDEAAALLEPITAELDVIENHAYHELLLLYRSERDPDALLAAASADDDAIAAPTTAYGVAAWHLYHGREDRARELCSRIVRGPQWAAFGHLAAEAELWRWSR